MKKLIIICYLLIVSLGYGDFQLAPQIQEINLDRPGTNRIYLKNDTNKLKKITIYSERPKDQKSESLYMGDWLVIYPKLVYLKPNSKKTIRMTARPPKGLEDGEYRSNLVFEELPVQNFDNVDENRDNVGVNIDVIHVLVSTVYGNKGKLEYSGKFEDFQLVLDKKQKITYLTSNIINTGTSALNTFYKVSYYNKDKEIGFEEISAGKIMRENESLAVLNLQGLTPEATQIKVEYFYKLKKDPALLKEGEKEDEEFKLGEKTMPIKIVAKEEFFKQMKIK